ncbi:hypothetical protein RJD40_20950 [Vibrio scophthalmi]|uniref:hypothetical protein n=1 Tax=Vibrio scophthalmi TaxID=45658 RepID=UPI003AACEA0F
MTSWLEVLKQECKTKSQRTIACELGVSAAQVNQALKGTYKGDVSRLKKLVEGHYMQQTVMCPVLGEVALSKCLFNQEREFAATNPQRIMLYKACRSGCPNSKLEKTINYTTHRQLLPNITTVQSVKEKVIYCKPVGDDKPPSYPKIGFEDSRQYLVHEQLNRLHKTAGGDINKLNSLLETELIHLAQMYSRVLKKQ